MSTFSPVVPVSCVCLATALSVGVLGYAASPAIGEEGGSALTAAQTNGSNHTPAVFNKTEVVYAALTPAGRLSEAYVVNRFEVEEAGYLYDIGEYDRIVPLTNGGSGEEGQASKDATYMTELSEEGVRGVDAKVGSFAYEGDISALELPWSITVVYRLDNKVVTPDELAGKSGHVTVTLETAANEKANPAFFESYMLQVTFTLDTERWRNVLAEGAAIAMAGSDRTVAFTALPGKEASFKLEADVTECTLAGAQIVGLPYSLAMEMPDTESMEGGLTQLSDAVGDLSSGARGLAEGASQLAGGIDAFSSGTQQFGSGLRTLATSSNTLVDGSAAIASGLGAMASGLGSADLSQLSQLGELPSTLRALASGLDELGGGASSLREGYSQALGALDAAVSALPEPTLTEAEIGSLMATAQASSNPSDVATANKLVETYQAAAQVKGTYTAVKDAFNGVEPLLAVFGGDASMEGSPAFFAASLRSIADGIDGASSEDSLAQLGALASGLQTLSVQYGDFHQGLVSYTQGVKRASSGFGTLGSGLTSLVLGANQLSSGTTQFADGAQTLADETAGLPQEMDEQIDNLMADYDFPEFEPVSFIDERNKNVSAVQFIMTLGAIELPEVVEAEEEEVPEPTLWDRFVALFI